MMYDSLSTPWQVCVDLAWEAYCAGSLPIAAVIVDEVGNIVATDEGSHLHA
jgi:tRNA(adenine34) deaminase